jgi:hypothetical protein
VRLKQAFAGFLTGKTRQAKLDELITLLDDIRATAVAA